MARYRKIDIRIWNDERFGRLSDDAKLVFLFLLTHQHMTSLGAMRATLPGLAAELGWITERFQQAFNELVTTTRSADQDSPDDHALVEFDDRACFIGLPNFLKYNGPENPNVVTSWAKSIDLLPECSLKTKVLKRANACMTGRSKAFVEAWEGVLESLPETLPKGFGEPFPKGMPNQEQEQKPQPEPEQEQKPEPRKRSAAVAARVVRPAKASKAHDVGKAQESIPIPAELDSPQFAQAWAEWKEHLRQKRRPMKPLQESKLLATWAAVGVERTIAAINHSIANGWQGLFEPNAKGNRTQGADLFRGLKQFVADAEGTK